MAKIVNGKALLAAQPIVDMLDRKYYHHGVSHGLSEVGYDLRVKQRVEFIPPDITEFMRRLSSGDIHSYEPWAIEELLHGRTIVTHPDGSVVETVGRTALASSIEKFQIPTNLWGELRNKSSWARHFVDAALGTDMEPDWKGFLTIEIVFNANKHIVIEAGCGILKAVFHELTEHASYGDGKYQNQPDEPIPSLLEPIK